MTSPYRAMCAELLAAIQLYTKLNPAASNMSPFELTEKLMDAMAATDAALAQPVAQEGDCSGCEGTPVASNSPCAVCGRIALNQPEPVAPTDEEIEEWADACSEAPLEEMDPEVHGWRRCFTAKEFSETIRAAIARWGRPTPQPVAVSERLPGPKDCEAGECWAWDTAAESWNRTHYALCNHFTHWLPANALPLPETNV